MIIAAWAMLVLALLMSTGRLTLAARVGLRGGYARLTIEWLLLRYTLRFRINLLRPPYGTLESVKGNGRVKRVKKPAHQKRQADRETPALPAPDTLTLHFLVGVENEPALSAMLCGWLREGAGMALRPLLPPGWPEVLRVSCESAPQENVFFVSAAGMILMTPVQIISIGIQMKKRGE